MLFSPFGFCATEIWEGEILVLSNLLGCFEKLNSFRVHVYVFFQKESFHFAS